MKTPFPPPLAPRTDRSGASQPKATALSPEWRCRRCDKLLGVCRDGRMHLRFARGHEYFAGFPVTATCRGCGFCNRHEGVRAR